MMSLVFACIALVGQAPSESSWKAGAARVAITPKTALWMSGYSSRTTPSRGVIHDLWAKALALQDPAGKRVMLITLDICGIDGALSNRIRDTLKTRFALDRDRVVIACSHTHSGPVVGTNLLTMYKIDDAERQRIAAYTEFLASAVISVASQALDRLAPARLAWATGRADFAVNRRNNKEADAPELRKRMALRGPVDHDVPVLKITSAAEALMAVVFSYACHCTVLDLDRFSGDYAGFAQIDIESKHPGAQAMFVAGCGADQNPLPRRSLELAAEYGRQLATSIETTLGAAVTSIDGPIKTSYEEIPLAFASIPTNEQIERDAKSSDFFIASRARKWLETIRKGARLEPVYPYPVQVWRLDGLSWVFLGGEVVVDYALRIKGNLGTSHTWVAGYCNDVMAYIPSLRVLKEGGYEGAGAMVYYGQPGAWSDEVEEAIMAAVAHCLRRARP